MLRLTLTTPSSDSPARAFAFGKVEFAGCVTKWSRHPDAAGRGFNLFYGPDLDLFRAILRGEFTISAFHARQVRPHLADLSEAQLSRLLKQLRLHGLLKQIGKRYKYYLTTLGRTVATAALKLRELVIIPMLNQPVAA
jgi:hypothetical protein